MLEMYVPKHKLSDTHAGTDTHMHRLTDAHDAHVSL